MPPVEDHPVHERTRQAAGAKNGCWNKPRPDPSGGYWAPNRQYDADGYYQNVPTWVPFAMSTECRFDQIMQPEKCEGCEHINPGYADSVRRDGK